MTDGERDRYLQEALRHAPDADAAAPPALSEAILREAHAAVAPPRAAWRDRIAAFWQALASPRLAGALASVMVLTLAGVMWWGRPIEQAMPVREAPVAAAPAAPAPSNEVAMASQAPVADAATVASPPAAATQRAPDTPIAPAAKAEPRRAAPPEAPARLAKERAPAITAVAPAPAAVQDEVRARNESSRDAAGAAPPAMPAAPAAAEPPAVTAAAPAPPPAAAEIAMAPKAAARSTPPAAALSGTASTTPRLSLAADATSWDAGDGRARAVDAAFAAFLARLETAAGGGVGLSAKLAPLAERNEARAIAPATLNLQRDGQPLRSLRLAGDLLVIETPDGATRRVPLAPGSGAALAARLAELAR